MSMEHVTGVIERVGQSVFNKVHHEYSYIRVRQDNGQSVMINKLVVMNTLDSYLEPEMKATLYWSEVHTQKFLVALRTSEELLIPHADLRTAKLALVMPMLTGLAMLVVGLVISLMLPSLGGLLSLVGLAVALFYFFKRSTFSHRKVTKYVEKQGNTLPAS